MNFDPGDGLELSLNVYTSWLRTEQTHIDPLRIDRAHFDAYALKNAIQSGHPDELRRLKHRVDPCELRKDDNWALRSAAKEGHASILRVLHDDFGLTVDDARANNNEALRVAIQSGDFDVMKCLVETYGMTVDDLFGGGITAPIALAVSEGRVAFLEYFAYRFRLTRANICYSDNFLLRLAVLSGHFNIVRFLRNEFRLNAEDARSHGNAILQIAVERGYANIVLYLREKFKLSTDDARENRNAALAIAARNGDSEMFWLIMRAFGLLWTDICESQTLSLLQSRQTSRHNILLNQIVKAYPLIQGYSVLMTEEMRKRGEIISQCEMESPSFYTGLEYIAPENSILKELSVDVCAICLCATLHAWKGSNRFLGGEDIAVTGCGHVYHQRCIIACRETPRVESRTTSDYDCPLCRGKDMIRAENVWVVPLADGELIDDFVARVTPEIEDRRHLISPP